MAPISASVDQLHAALNTKYAAVAEELETVVAAAEAQYCTPASFSPSELGARAALPALVEVAWMPAACRRCPSPSLNCGRHLLLIPACRAALLCRRQGACLFHRQLHVCHLLPGRLLLQPDPVDGRRPEGRGVAPAQLHPALDLPLAQPPDPLLLPACSPARRCSTAPSPPSSTARTPPTSPPSTTRRQREQGAGASAAPTLSFPVCSPTLRLPPHPLAGSSPRSARCQARPLASRWRRCCLCLTAPRRPT